MPITEHLFAFDQLTADELGVLKTFEKRLAAIYPLKQHATQLVQELEICKTHPENRNKVITLLNSIQKDVLSAFANVNFDAFTEEKLILDREAQDVRFLFQELKRQQSIGGQEHNEACKKVQNIIRQKEQEIAQIGKAETVLEHIQDAITIFKGAIKNEKMQIERLETLVQETQIFRQQDLDRLMLAWRQLKADIEEIMAIERRDVYDKLQPFLHEKMLAEQLITKLQSRPKKWWLFRQKINKKDIEQLAGILEPTDFSHLLSVLPKLTKEGWLTNDALNYLQEIGPEKAREQKIEMQKTTHLAEFDRRTGMLRADIFKAKADALIAVARRNNSPLALLFIDIDKFKSINDQLGHEAGDIALTAVATIIRNCIRESDVEGRWGGEELLIIAPDTTKDKAIKLAERIRTEIQEQTGKGKFDAPREITVSIGISFYPDDGSTFTELFNKADERVYKAKDSGRNRVVSDSGADIREMPTINGKRDAA